MEKQNPFSLYDFLGYFIPGSITLFGVITIVALSKQPVSLDDFLKSFQVLGRPELYFPLILLAYVVGHILSFLSSITIEKYSTWLLGYPSRYLLGFEPKGFFDVKRPRWTRIGVRLFVALLIVPVAAMDLILGVWLKMRLLYAKPLDPLLCDILKRKIRALAESEADEPDVFAKEGDFFRFVYHYALEHSKAHFAKMQNYVALYGLLRSLSLAAVIFFWVAVFLALRQTLPVGFELLLPAVLALAAFVLYADFMKFYRRFSLEAMMALAVMYPPRSESPDA